MKKSISPFFRRLRHTSWQFLTKIQDNHINASATMVTFYLLLSIFPLLMIIIETLKIFAFNDPTIILQFTHYIPLQVSGFIEYIINDLSSSDSPAVLPVAIIGAAWAASKSVMAVISALNIAYEQKEQRPYLMVRLLAVLYTIAFVIILILTAVLIIFGQKIYQMIHHYFSLPAQSPFIFSLARYLFSFLLITFFLLILYRTTWTKKVKFRQLLPGALLASGGWLISALAMSIYVDHSANLSYMYGSLTNLIGLMLWINICSFFLLLGGELNAFLLAIPKKTPLPKTTTNSI